MSQRHARIKRAAIRDANQLTGCAQLCAFQPRIARKRA